MQTRTYGPTAGPDWAHVIRKVLLDAGVPIPLTQDGSREDIAAVCAGRLNDDGTVTVTVQNDAVTLPADADAIVLAAPVALAEYRAADAAQNAPAQRWARMTRLEKAQWYTLYLIAKRTGAPIDGWTFIEFLSYVKTNCIDAAPWEAEGLP